MTNLDLLTQAAVALGVITSGETLSPEEAQDCLLAANDLVESWNVDGLAVYNHRHDAYRMTGAKTSYTIGPATRSTLATAITLTTGISAAATSLTLTGDLTQLANGNVILIDNEPLTITGIASQIVTATRSVIQADAHLSGAQVYLTSSVPDLVGLRPVRITDAGLILSGVRTPVRILTKATEWAAIADKSATGLLAQEIYHDNSFPLAILSPHPIPSGTPTLDLYSWQQLARFEGFTDLISWPPAYLRAITLNLAIEYAARVFSYAPVPAALPQQAAEAKALIRSLNTQLATPDQVPPPAQQGA